MSSKDSWRLERMGLSNGFESCEWTPPVIHNYPIKSALMSSSGFCPAASPHSVCKVRIPSLPQFDSVKAWKQIKSCCFSQSQRDAEAVGTRLTRGSFATCCFCLRRGLKCWHKSLLVLFVLLFLLFASVVHLWTGSEGSFYFLQTSWFFCLLVLSFGV